MSTSPTLVDIHLGHWLTKRVRVVRVHTDAARHSTQLHLRTTDSAAMEFARQTIKNLTSPHVLNDGTMHALIPKKIDMKIPLLLEMATR